VGRIRRRIRRVWNLVAPGVPALLRVSPGVWWIARRDVVSDSLFAGTFEPRERALFAGLVQPGMTVLDVGAHAGLYSLIASKRVGPLGRVIAFEPSPRERERLAAHVRLNKAANVVVEPVALGEEDGEADLFVVDAEETGCNSLLPGEVGPGHAVRVPLRSLDGYAIRAGLERVDVIKMDVEGAELSVLRGARALIARTRPVVLCEIEEARTRPWGYNGRAIVDLLNDWKYDCFSVADTGDLEPASSDRAWFNGNYLARPR
jgi:FkbM family methyltransferase